MCGFVVTTDTNNLKLMLKKQQFRGPDNMSGRIDRGIGMGHVLLDINGEHQVQPYKTSKGNYIVFNGEMYDTPIPNDTQYLAEGLETYGFQFLAHNDWHGALCWYNPEKRQLIAVRDHFGAKPLWLQKQGTKFTFTTSLRSLLDVTPNKKLEKLFQINALLEGSESPYEDVVKLEPGAYYTIDLETNTWKKRNLWDGFLVEDRKFEKEVFRTKLVESIQKIAKTKQKVGLFLSGGLDSTMVLSAVKDMGLDLTVYTCAYDDTKGKYYEHNGFKRESKMAQQTCKEWGIPIKTVVLRQDLLHHYSRDWLNKTRFPWSDLNRQAPRYMLAKHAAQDGCKVILTGDSADEIFTGYYHHRKYFFEDYKDTKLQWYKDMKWYPRIRHGRDAWNDLLLADMLVTSETNILAADQTCGMFGMESRPCFLGQNFVKYCFRFDGKTKFKQKRGWDTGTYKYLLREVMGDYLPEHIRNRPNKTGWSSPWDNNHKETQKLNRMLDWQYVASLS